MFKYVKLKFRVTRSHLHFAILVAAVRTSQSVRSFRKDFIRPDSDMSQIVYELIRDNLENETIDRAWVKSMLHALVIHSPSGFSNYLLAALDQDADTHTEIINLLAEVFDLTYLGPITSAEIVNLNTRFTQHLLVPVISWKPHHAATVSSFDVTKVVENHPASISAMNDRLRTAWQLARENSVFNGRGLNMTTEVVELLEELP